MADDALHNLTITEAAARLEAGSLSPVALTEAVLSRMEATEPALNAYVTRMTEGAREDARAAEARARAGKRLGPLDGIPVAVKDLYDTADVVTTGGTGAYRYRVPSEDAAAVALLRRAGAVITGKTNTHELAFGGTTNNMHYGATHNPWDLQRVPGGSSGGSGAALAVGSALGALGTDTGGSIRIPAAFCGVTGHKPTYGLVSRAGIIPLSHTLDHAGPMARTAHDCALMLNALQGYDERDLDSVERPAEDFTAALHGDVRGLRLAVIPSLSWNTTPAVHANFEASLDTLRSLGVEVTRAEPMAGEEDWRNHILNIMRVEAYDYAEHLMSRSVSQIGAPVRSRIEPGGTVPAWVYARELDARKRIERAFERCLREERLDGYVLPTSPITAFGIDPDPTRDQAPPVIFQNTTIFDLTHQPSISVPNGFDAEDLPTGLMVTTGLWQDALALRIGHAFQQATDFHTRRPPL
ncbi:MAG: amidase [Dehalococcoidia bacterium]|nr:amidase [Dehalococcoidia bacterium]